MDTTYEGIVEVTQCGRRAANFYLANGYTLLSMAATNREREGHNGWFIRRDFTYVLGRPAEVPHYDPPPWEPYHDPTTPADPAPTEETFAGEPSPP